MYKREDLKIICNLSLFGKDLFKKKNIVTQLNLKTYYFYDSKKLILC